MYNSSALISMRFLLAVSTSKFLSYMSFPEGVKKYDSLMADRVTGIGSLPIHFFLASDIEFRLCY
jgi:hypothetical protein